MTALRRFRYRLWWAWWAFRIGSDALIASGHARPGSEASEAESRDG